MVQTLSNEAGCRHWETIRKRSKNFMKREWILILLFASNHFSLSMPRFLPADENFKNCIIQGIRMEIVCFALKNRMKPQCILMIWAILSRQTIHWINHISFFRNYPIYTQKICKQKILQQCLDKSFAEWIFASRQCLHFSKKSSISVSYWELKSIRFSFTCAVLLLIPRTDKACDND